MKKKQITIVGSGPSGYSAALYAANMGIDVTLFAGAYNNAPFPGGQLMLTTLVENYPGFTGGIDGVKLMENMHAQSINMGIEVIFETVHRIKKEGSQFVCHYANTHSLFDAVIIATGSQARVLNVEGKDTYWQKGISTCAVCDGALPIFRNRTIVILGGGNTAMKDAVYLSAYASEIIVIHRSESFKATPLLLERAQQIEKIKFITNHTLSSIHGEKNITHIVIENTHTKEKTQIDCSGLFFAIGYIPNLAIIKEMDIVVKNECIQVGYYGKNSASSIKGIFAVGDIANNQYRQAIVAAGSGYKAAIDVYDYLMI